MRKRQEGVWSLLLRPRLALHGPQMPQRLHNCITRTITSHSCMLKVSSLRRWPQQRYLQGILHMRLQPGQLKAWHVPLPCWRVRPRLQVAQELRKRPACWGCPVKGPADQMQ